jgi:hypothetical protein
MPGIQQKLEREGCWIGHGTTCGSSIGVGKRFHLSNWKAVAMARRCARTYQNAMRACLGLRNSIGPIEKANDLVMAKRQNMTGWLGQKKARQVLASVSPVLWGRQGHNTI